MYNKMSSFESASSDGGDLCQQRVCDPDAYYETSGSYYTQLYPADSQNPVGSTVSGNVPILLDEEGYWGSPCSSSESQPDGSHRDRYSTPPPPPALAPPLALAAPPMGGTTTTTGSTVLVHGLRHVSSSSQQQHAIADQSSSFPSSSSSSASSSSSSSVGSSTSSSPYGVLPSAGYHHQQQQQRHLAHDGGHNQHHHHHQASPAMYCAMVYDKGTAAYVPDEGYYGGNGGTSMDIVSGSGGDDEHLAHLHLAPTSSGALPGHGGVPVVRVVKRRNTANKKERRRTQSINSAYSSLRDRIPNVPNDTKLSKIKTLRLAISYIAHLLAVVNGNQDPSCDFRAELVPSSRKINAERRAQKTLLQNLSTTNGDVTSGSRKVKGRTGWPQHVWALETKTTIK